MVNRIMLAVQFLTIIPIPATMDKSESYHKVMAFFPLAGLLIGAVTLAVYWISSHVMTTIVALLLAMVTQFLVTGGLHMDGLADTADGCMSGRSTERKLEIMRDSRLGTHGVIVLMFIVLIKLATLWSMPAEQQYTALFLAPVVGRFALVMGAWRASSPRKSGLGNLFIGVITLREVTVALVIVLLCLLISPMAYLPFLAAVLACKLIKTGIGRTLGGITGDVLGALNEVSEALFMLFMLMIVNGS